MPSSIFPSGVPFDGNLNEALFIDKAFVSGEVMVSIKDSGSLRLKINNNNGTEGLLEFFKNNLTSGRIGVSGTTLLLIAEGQTQDMRLEATSGILFLCNGGGSKISMDGNTNFGQSSINVVISAGGALAQNNRSFIVVEANTGVTDDLDNITGGLLGDELFLIARAGDTIDITNIGNIDTDTGANLVMTGDTIIHLFRANTNYQAQKMGG